MKKTILFLGGVAVLAVVGVAGFAWYSLFVHEKEKNKQRTEAARAARWQKNGQEIEEELKTFVEHEKEQ